MKDPLPHLAEICRVPESRFRGLREVDEATLAAISTSVDSIMAEEDVAVDEGIRSAVAIVPRPLRAVARTLLFGEDR